MRFGVEQYWPKPQVERISYNYTKSEEAYGLTAIPFFELKGEL